MLCLSIYLFLFLVLLHLIDFLNAFVGFASFWTSHNYMCVIIPYYSPVTWLFHWIITFSLSPLVSLSPLCWSKLLSLHRFLFSWSISYWEGSQILQYDGKFDNSPYSSFNIFFFIYFEAKLLVHASLNFKYLFHGFNFWYFVNIRVLFLFSTAYLQVSLSCSYYR